MSAGNPFMYNVQGADQQRDDYLQALVEQSDASRLEGQDAEMQDNAERVSVYGVAVN